MSVSGSEKVIIDSYGWIEYFSDGRLAGKYSKHIEGATPDNCLTPAIIIYEVYKKLKASYSEEEAMMAVAHMEHFTAVVEIGMNEAMEGADASIEEGLSMADALIMGVARRHGARIVTSDPHFKGKEGVVFVE